MRRLVITTLLALVAVPAPASAARPKISSKPPSLSAGGIMRIEVANPNRHVLTGKATVVVGKRTIASKSVRLRKRSVTVVKVRLSKKAQSAIQAAGGKAKVALRVRRPGSRKTITAARTLKVQLPGAGGPASPAPAAGPAPSPGAAPSTPTRFVGRVGTEGPHDDFEATIENGQMTFTKTPLISVLCLEAGGSYRSSISFEPFLAAGPWAIGTDGQVQQPGVSVNQLVSSGERTITYKVTGTAQAADKVTGELGMSYSDSQYDFFSNQITFINCMASPPFEAIPAT